MKGSGKCMYTIKEVRDGGYFDFYGENLFYFEAVTEKLLERIAQIEERQKLLGLRKLCDNVRYRIKSPESMKAKLNKRGFPETRQSAVSNVYDAAGIRIICPYLDDVYIVAKEIARQSDIEVLEIKDYIKRPKKNGYRSYHMIVETSVMYMGETHFVKIEIQIRTMVMNSWASAEHQLRYKKSKTDGESFDMLKKCAEEMHTIDRSMMKIRNMMEKTNAEEACKEAVNRV